MNEKKDDLFIIPAFSLMKKRDDAVCAGNASDGGNTDKEVDTWEDDEESDDMGFNTSFSSMH